MVAVRSANRSSCCSAVLPARAIQFLVEDPRPRPLATRGSHDEAGAARIRQPFRLRDHPPRPAPRRSGPVTEVAEPRLAGRDAAAARLAQLPALGQAGVAEQAEQVVDSVVFAPRPVAARRRRDGPEPRGCSSSSIPSDARDPSPASGLRPPRPSPARRTEAGPQDVAEIAHRRASAPAAKFVPPPQTPPKPSGSPLAAGDHAQTRTLRTRGLAATSGDLVRQQPLQACKIVQKALPNLILKLHAGDHSESAGRSSAKLLWGTGRASPARVPQA